MTVRRDLYWDWARATKFVYTGAAVEGRWVQLLIELVPDQPNAVFDLHDHLVELRKGLIPQPYLKPGVRFCTAWLKQKADVGLLPAALVVRFKLGVASRISKSFSELYSAFYPMGPDRDEKSAKGADVARCRLAVIDDYINHEHPTFCGADGNTRVVCRWDQSTDDSHGSTLPNFGYGMLLGDVRPFAEREKKSATSHGTHVASLAGGRETPPYRMRNSSPADFANALPEDDASSVELAMVMLPDLTVADTSGGALGVNVLDALTFLCQDTDPGTHLIVNLSFGTMGGAHDGTSLLEAAMADLIDRRAPNLTIVLPSGNSFESQCHAVFSLASRGSQPLKWRILPDDRTCSFLELWLPSDANVSVKVKPPGTIPEKKLSLDASVQWKEGASVFAGAWYASSPANGNGKQMVLIALAPTKAKDGVVAPHGDWVVTVTNKGRDLARVDAWIERDDASFGRRLAGRQSYFVADSSARFMPPARRGDAKEPGVSGLGTLNGIGCGSRVVVVGGCEFRSGKAARYPSAGDLAAVRVPDGATPSEESPMQQGLPGAGNAPLSVVRMRGTSVAAPVAARWFVNEVLQSRCIPWPPKLAQPALEPPDLQLGYATYRWGR